MALIFNNLNAIKSLNTNFLNKIKKIIKQILNDYEFKEGKIIINLVNDNELLQINKNFLNHDYYTDIIVFNEIKNNYLFAELYISYDRLIENANKYNQSIENETARLIIHGILHSCGEDDNDEKSKQSITIKENYYLNFY